jgi:hypothetical protein
MNFLEYYRLAYLLVSLFLSLDGIDKIFTQAGLVKEQNIADKRLQINRGKQLKMYRVWIQCKYVKPI